MTFIIIILLIYFPFVAIYNGIQVRKLKREITILKNNTISKKKYNELNTELIEKDKLNQALVLEKYLKREKDLISIKVDKFIVPSKKFSPSDLSYKQLEDCVNHFIELNKNQ